MKISEHISSASTLQKCAYQNCKKCENSRRVATTGTDWWTLMPEVHEKFDLKDKKRGMIPTTQPNGEHDTKTLLVATGERLATPTVPTNSFHEKLTPDVCKKSQKNWSFSTCLEDLKRTRKKVTDHSLYFKHNQFNFKIGSWMVSDVLSRRPGSEAEAMCWFACHGTSGLLGFGLGCCLCWFQGFR